MPALVTLHNATGALAPIASSLGEARPFNTFVTHDAAALLCKLHSLIVTARNNGEPQRNYLLLDHATL